MRVDGTPQNQSKRRSMTVAPESFSGIQTSISAVHLMLDGVEVISLSTVVPIVQEARRMFEKQQWRKSSLNFNRAVVAFEQNTAQWRQRMNEAIAFARRQSTTPIVKRKKGRGGSIAELAKLNGEKTRVETQIAAAARLIRRLKVDLETLTVAEEGDVLRQNNEELPSKEERPGKEQVSSKEQVPSEEPSSAATDPTANAGDHELTRRNLAREVELQVTAGQGEARFTPSFPYGRLILLDDTGEIVRIRRIRVEDVLHVQDPDDTTNDKQIPLHEFVRRVQAGGVWLLQPRESSSEMEHD